MQRQREIAYRYSKGLRKKATKPEKIVKRILRDLGINFKFQWAFFGKKRFVIADFYLPDQGIVLEVDGKDHYKEDALIYDEYRTKFLKNKCGIVDVIRLPNLIVLKNTEKIEKELAERFCEASADYYSEAFRRTINE